MRGLDKAQATALVALVKSLIKQGKNVNTVVLTKVSLKEYLEYIKGSENILDRYLRTLKSVSITDEYVEYLSNIGKCFRVYYSGAVSIIQNGAWTQPKKRFVSDKNLHCSVNIDAGGKTTAPTVERLVMLAYAIANDEVPLELHNLSCNVMDLSGSYATAQSLGIQQDFHIWNLEWVPQHKGSAHYDNVTDVFKITGNVYAISENDCLIGQLTQYPDILKEYLDIVKYRLVNNK